MIRNRPAEGKNDIVSALLFTDGLSSNFHSSNSTTYVCIADRAPILFFLSGLPNVGPKSAKEIIAGLTTPDANADEKKKEQSLIPCTVNAFGFGADHDANLLRAIAESGM